MFACFAAAEKSSWEDIEQNEAGVVDRGQFIGPFTKVTVVKHFFFVCLFVFVKHFLTAPFPKLVVSPSIPFPLHFSFIGRI